MVKQIYVKDLSSNGVVPVKIKKRVCEMSAQEIVSTCFGMFR